jgi:hypothetical protein
VVLGRLARAALPKTHDPNADMEARFCAMLRELARREIERDVETIGIVYPT